MKDKKSMEQSLSIDERRARQLIAMLRGWQAKGQMGKASDRLKMICDKLKDVREIAFLAWLDGKASNFAEIADIFERYTGTDLSSVMMKLQAVDKYEIKVPHPADMMPGKIIKPS